MTDSDFAKLMPAPDGRRLSSSKWRRFAGDVLPMHVAEMDYPVAPQIRSLLAQMVDRSDLGYLGPLPELQPAFAGFAEERWGWALKDARIRLATDVGVAAVELLRVLVAPGRGVVISSPVYSSFQKWIQEVRGQIIDAPLRRVGDEWQLDLAAIEAAFAAGHRVYLLCHPQNPVGRIHSRAELTALAELAAKYEAIVISDEIHAPLAWQEFAPFLSLGATAERVGIAITSSSKAWNTAGLKAALILTEGPQHDRLLAKLPEAMHWRTSLPGAFAMVTSFAESTEWLDSTIANIRSNFQLLADQLQSKLPAARLAMAASTYLAWIDLSGYGKFDWAARLLKDGKLAVVAGPDHGGASYEGFVRLNIATSPERVVDAVERMALVLNGGRAE